MNPNTESTYQVVSLYVGDLKQDVDDRILWNAFSGFGQILSVKVCRDSTTGNSLGYAYVNFRTLEGAEKAMNALNYTQIEGKPCRIMWSMRDSQKRRNNIGNLFLKNIDASIDSRALFEAFSVFGPIMSCKLVTDAFGKSKGYAFIQFCNEKDADAAIEKANGIEFLNKTLVVSRFLTKSQRLGDDSEGKPRFTNVFCKNFGEDWSITDMESVFDKFGPVTSCVIMKDDNGKSKGFGFVNFEKPEHAEEAVSSLAELKTSTGKPVYIARAMKRAERVEILKQEYFKKRQENMKKCQNLNVYIKPLDPEITDDKLREHFEKFGTIISHKIMRDQFGKSRGFGFVCFTTPEEALSAIQEMDKKVIETKPLLVTLAQTKEERRRELLVQNFGRIPSSQMYAPGSFPLMYAPQQFPAGYQQMPSRYPQMPVGPRALQRPVSQMNPQAISNHPRGNVPFQHYQNNNFQFSQRGRQMTGAGMPLQQLKGPMVGGLQSRSNPQQYSQGPVYQHMQDGQAFRMHNAPVPTVQASMNFVATSVNAVSGKSTSTENAGLVSQSIPFVQDDRKPERSTLQILVENVSSAVKTMYSTESDEFHAKLANTVISSLAEHPEHANNETALMEVISRAKQFLLQSISGKGKDASLNVDAVSST